MDAINSSKPISTCGEVTFAILFVLELVFVSIAANTTWWQVWFWDCIGDSAYFFMVMNDGICNDEDKDTSSDWDDCHDWDDVKWDSDAEDAADDFISANDMFSTFLAFSVILIVLCGVSLFINERQLNILRVFAAVMSFLSFIFVVVVFSITNDSYFYDLGNYGDREDDCNSNVTLPGVGYFFGILLLPFSLGSTFALIYPCCGCVRQVSSVTEPLQNTA